MTHIQFHSYGGGIESEDSFSSKVAAARRIRQRQPQHHGRRRAGDLRRDHQHDGRRAARLFPSKVYKTKWFSSDTELEAGCGITPIEYKNTSLIHAWQWAIGLEWYLMVKDPWRVVMSTDHPNGGSFLAYPQIIRLLMDRTYREDMLKTVPAKIREQSALAGLDRQYTLSEIAIITRAGPARILGLKNKGHLGPGADADITIYTPDPNKETMFELPRFVIKSGRLLVEQGDIREEFYGKTAARRPGIRPGVEPDIEKWFEDSYSIRWRNYPVDADHLHDHELIK